MRYDAPVKFASSPTAARAWQLVRQLQQRMVVAQEAIDANGQAFVESTWLRDGGDHGGGSRWGIADTAVFDRASVNVSQVHYDDMLDKRLASATALSTIIHPRHPHAPSVHLHVSWTELRGEAGYWRIMSDLNPSIADGAFAASSRARFTAQVAAAAGTTFDHGVQQGDLYFWIPALARHRGVFHFYLEQYSSGNFDADAALAQRVAEHTIDTHAAIIAEALTRFPAPTAAERQQQLAYHTLYFFQVLTLDRGTTSGLLVHDQNDVGILGSLPSHVDRSLLTAWAGKTAAPLDHLVHQLVAALPAGSDVAIVDDACKQALATTVRRFFAAHPDALAQQARADQLPPTVINHK